MVRSPTDTRQNTGGHKAPMLFLVLCQIWVSKVQPLGNILIPEFWRSRETLVYTHGWSTCSAYPRTTCQALLVGDGTKTQISLMTQLVPYALASRSSGCQASHPCTGAHCHRTSCLRKTPSQEEELWKGQGRGPAIAWGLEPSRDTSVFWCYARGSVGPRCTQSGDMFSVISKSVASKVPASQVSLAAQERPLCHLGLWVTQGWQGCCNFSVRVLDWPHPPG